VKIKMKWVAGWLLIGLFTSAIVVVAVTIFNGGSAAGVEYEENAPANAQPTAEPVDEEIGSANPVDEMDAALVYARCIRENGFPEWPDPLPDGTFMMRRDQGMSFNDPRRAAAMEACQDLRPAGFSGSAGIGGAAGMSIDQETFLAFAQCMRDNGVSGFPDPSPSGGGMIIGPDAGIDPNSPTFQAAVQTCQAALQGGQ
jgi:hypothetical protein